MPESERRYTQPLNGFTESAPINVLVLTEYSGKLPILAAVNNRFHRVKALSINELNALVHTFSHRVAGL